ncbi:hypothetical protein BDZ91DRAFT_733879 [Kalaharituber pfeilii]|nr:hypothetical protein BDZ91DRAFT_733879 [Kalaharituber pfeilii]
MVHIRTVVSFIFLVAGVLWTLFYLFIYFCLWDRRGHYVFLFCFCGCSRFMHFVFMCGFALRWLYSVTLILVMVGYH